MTGPAERQSRQPLENRKAEQANFRAKRSHVLRALRSEAAQARAFAFGLLRAQYAAKLADARQRYSGAELAAALAAISAEQRAAEQALRLRLAGEARARRGNVPRDPRRGFRVIRPARQRRHRARRQHGEFTR